MDLKNNFLKKRFVTVPSWRFFWLLFILFIVVFGIFFVSLVSYGYSFKDRVLPGLNIGQVPIGGMEKNQLKLFLDNMNDKLINDGLSFSYNINGKEENLIIYPLAGAVDGGSELAYIDVEKEVERLINWGKESGMVKLSLVVIRLKIKPVVIYIKNVMVDEDRLLDSLKSAIDKNQIAPHDANIKIETITPLKYKITSSTVGIVYDFKGLADKVIKSWSKLESTQFEIVKHEEYPNVLTDDVLLMENRLPAIFDDGGLQLTYIDPYNSQEYDWLINQNKIKDWLQVQKNVGVDLLGGGIVFGLEKENVMAFLNENVASKINVEAKNAKFEISETGRVLEFQGSRPGVKLDVEKVYKDINEAFIERTWHDEVVSKSVQLTVDKVEPLTKTGDVNDFGIKEILGVGVSDYSRSPINRIRNIKNAVNKLNGVLIAPGGIFSTIEYTKPFTIAGGYLPELVIKGDEVKPEIGGGLCQIGTTLFRMAMNSGMKIIDRTNHSLVIFHYNDPVNGNPGTDATVYDPAPDFKFRNDTDNYVLIQTYMDENDEFLYFTLWGTNDGRKGTFSHPLVQRWIPHGDLKIIETTKLELGKENCQSAFLGADASFTYTRIFSSGEKEETIFESHYRPLPKICLVGVEEKKECEEGDTECIFNIEQIVSSTETLDL